MRPSNMDLDTLLFLSVRARFYWKGKDTILNLNTTSDPLTWYSQLWWVLIWYKRYYFITLSKS